MREHLEGEQAAFRTRGGYIFKKSGAVDKNPKIKKVKPVGDKDEPKKTAESWLRKRRTQQACKPSLVKPAVAAQSIAFQLQVFFYDRTKQLTETFTFQAKHFLRHLQSSLSNPELSQTNI